MLIGVTATSLCQFPYGSMTALGAIDGVAIYGVWLTSIFCSMICVSIVCLSASYTVEIAMIGVDIV
jgi:hypothetical protein